MKTSDTLFVHSSVKALGTVEGGAATVIGALEDAVGPEGLLLMPSFNLVAKEQRASTWNHASTPSTVGWLTEFFRQMPGTVRSDHYSHSVAARGRNAGEFVGDHCSREGPLAPWDKEPWGRTYGTHSPFFRAYRDGGKVLMLGVDYESSTFMHLVEVLDWNRRLGHDSKAEYFWIQRTALGAHWDGLGRLSRGRVGDADSRLFPVADFVDTLLDAIGRCPSAYFKWWKPSVPAP